MDAKTKANFINSVAAGQTVPCARCGAANSASDKFCVTCGNELGAKPEMPGFAPVAETAQASENNKPGFASAAKEPVAASQKQNEAAAVFANGLPAWDIVPPEVMVRRR